MKHIAIIAALLATSAISFMAGRESKQATVVSMSHADSIQWEKDFQVACKLSDVYRNVIDNISEINPDMALEIEEIYYEHMVNLDCDTTLIITREDVESTRYYWIY